MSSNFEEEQRQLCQLWKKARKDGCMPPWQQARVYGLSEAWKDMYGETTYGKAKRVAERVTVQGRGKKRPSPEAVGQLLKKMDDDDDWFPGKVYGSLGGRPSALSETSKSIIAASSMAMKERGVEPTYALVIAQGNTGLVGNLANTMQRRLGENGFPAVQNGDRVIGGNCEEEFVILTIGQGGEEGGFAAGIIPRPFFCSAPNGQGACEEFCSGLIG